MPCSLSPAADGSKSHFTAKAGQVALKTVVTAGTKGNILFTSHCSIKDQAGNDVAYTLQNNNQGLQFTAATGHTYTAFLLYAFLPSTSDGDLVEDCTGSALDIPLSSPNVFNVLVIDC